MRGVMSGTFLDVVCVCCVSFPQDRLIMAMRIDNRSWSTSATYPYPFVVGTLPQLGGFPARDLDLTGDA